MAKARTTRQTTAQASAGTREQDPTASGMDDAQHLLAHETMLRIRRFEQRASQLFANAELPGFIHLSIGQEAVATGAIAALRSDDLITATHRGHGQIIAKGGELAPMFAELMGREGGYCRGKGGSMHIFRRELGVLGANGILGASQPIAAGAALASQYRGTDQVTVTFFGEGASAQGAVHEAMNLAALWKLPVVFVCEANGWAELTPYPVHVSVPSLADRAGAYGMPGESVDGNDVHAVHEATARAVRRARAAKGPSLIEARTVRWHGHFEGDPQRYRDARELETLAEHDPIAHSERVLLARGAVDSARLTALAEGIDREVEAAIERARQSAQPDASQASVGVYK